MRYSSSSQVCYGVYAGKKNDPPWERRFINVLQSLLYENDRSACVTSATVFLANYIRQKCLMLNGVSLNVLAIKQKKNTKKKTNVLQPFYTFYLVWYPSLLGIFQHLSYIAALKLCDTRLETSDPPFLGGSILAMHFELFRFGIYAGKKLTRLL